MAREGADITIVYLPQEQEDAEKTKELIESEGRSCLLISGDLRSNQTCEKAVKEHVGRYANRLFHLALISSLTPHSFFSGSGSRESIYLSTTPLSNICVKTLRKLTWGRSRTSSGPTFCKCLLLQNLHFLICQKETRKAFLPFIQSPICVTKLDTKNYQQYFCCHVSWLEQYGRLRFHERRDRWLHSVTSATASSKGYSRECCCVSQRTIFLKCHILMPAAAPVRSTHRYKLILEIPIPWKDGVQTNNLAGQGSLAKWPQVSYSWQARTLLSIVGT